MSNLAALQTWALPRLEKIIPFDRDTLTQIINAAATQSRGPTGAGEYLQELLGFGEDALDFISAFTEKMAAAAPRPASVPTPTPAQAQASSTPQQQGKTTLLNTSASGRGRGGQGQQSQQQKQPAWSVNESVPAVNRRLPGARGGKMVQGGFKREVRKVDDAGGADGLKVYRKKDEEDEYWGSGSGAGKKNGGGGRSGATTPQPQSSTPPPPKEALANQPTPAAAAGGENTAGKQKKQQGTLTSDLLAPSSASKSKSSNHGIKMTANSSTMRAPGGGPLSDIESALRALELSTNPSHPEGKKSRPSCNCLATVHDLLLAAPNCLSCGKIICIKEGPGPCTFCGTPLLSSEETQQMISFLREERGREKMEAGNRAVKKAEVARVPKPYHAPPLPSSAVSVPPQLGFGYGTPKNLGSGTAGGEDSEAEADAAALARAKAHRDKLLSFQTNNAQRTKIIDEAADFDTSAVESGGYSGLSAWASPQERALQLKKQQKRMREVEWAAKDGWEKRKVVVSLNISGVGKGGKPMITSRREMREVEFDEAEREEGNFGMGKGVVDVRSRGGEEDESGVGGGGNSSKVDKGGKGRYSHNPLLKGYIKPVYTPPVGAGTTKKKKPPVNKSTKGKQTTIDDYTQGDDGGDDGDDDYENDEEIPEVVRERRKGGWRRVLQDDLDISRNEQWILDGGVGGAGPETGMTGKAGGGRGAAGDEPGCG